MSVEMILRCDVGSDGPEGYTSDVPFCYSKRHVEEPHANIERVAEAGDALQYIESNARTHGWARMRGKWVCPNCRTLF